MKGRMISWMVVLGSAFVILLTLTTGTRLVAQTYTGSIVGNVTDPSGAGVPDTTMTAKNVNTGITRSIKSDAEGSYRIGDLIPALYTVRAEKGGFLSGL